MYYQRAIAQSLEQKLIFLLIVSYHDLVCNENDKSKPTTLESSCYVSNLVCSNAQLALVVAIENSDMDLVQ